jgi:DNA-binding MarR family transcriptional regulator
MTNASLAAVLHLLRAHARIEEGFSGKLGAVHGLSLKETLLLMHLARAERERLPRVDLARRLSVSPSTVTRMAAPLEKLGLIGREPDARDARLAYVTLTDAGKILVEHATATLERLSGETFSDRWSAQEIERLGSLLGRLTAGQPGSLVG